MPSVTRKVPASTAPPICAKPSTRRSPAHARDERGSVVGLAAAITRTCLEGDIGAAVSSCAWPPATDRDDGPFDGYVHQRDHYEEHAAWQASAAH